MGCKRTEDDAPKGWAQYSVERFFDRPQVSHVSCGSTTLTLSNVVDSFKHSFDVPGHVFVYEGTNSTIMHQEKFTFKRSHPHKFTFMRTNAHTCACTHSHTCAYTI